MSRVYADQLRPAAGELRVVGFRDGLDPVGSWRSGASLRLETAATAVMLSPPGAPGHGVQEDQRVSPTLEGGVAMPGGVGLGALVDLPARPFVPLAAGDRYSRAAVVLVGGSASIVPPFQSRSRFVVGSVRRCSG